MIRMNSDLTFAAAHQAFVYANETDGVITRYAEPWRHYHDETHISEMGIHLTEAEKDGVKIHDGAAACAFVLWHDAIYDPQAPHGRNETLSAELCRAEFAAIAEPVSVERACTAILATIGHAPPKDISACPDIAILLDVDLSILGADAERFQEYAAAIRKEYAHVPDEVYVPKRREVLGRFLQRDRLYLTDWAHERWDGRARENLRTLLG